MSYTKMKSTRLFFLKSAHAYIATTVTKVHFGNDLPLTQAFDNAVVFPSVGKILQPGFPEELPTPQSPNIAVGSVEEHFQMRTFGYGKLRTHIACVLCI